jgi:hypothetical protein
VLTTLVGEPRECTYISRRPSIARASVHLIRVLQLAADRHAGGDPGGAHTERAEQLRQVDRPSPPPSTLGLVAEDASRIA